MTPITDRQVLHGISARRSRAKPHNLFRSEPFAADFTTFRPDREYDLVVNVASLHHVRHLYRFCELLAGCLSDEGLFVNWDYVGPSRNQYPDRQVRMMRDANQALPARFRNLRPLRPKLRDMLALDPTEAVHSAEIPGAVGQYFDFLEYRPMGGGLAYQLLWNNIAEFLKDEPEGEAALADLLEADERALRNRAVPCLFSFFVCKPRRAVPSPRALFDRRVREPLREAFAVRNGGLYPGELLRFFAERFGYNA
ncbi:MAG: hypothetical protein FJZ01_24800 [Candidatus Sericytochromatia bacterium]|nr:hypothetical protein [Candidatus Tanganyikabacteria bacterium]